MCKGTTQSGRPCRKTAVTPDGFCAVHVSPLNDRLNGGKIFEEAVAGVLESLGYQVKRDSLISAGQVDLLATMHVGVIPHRVLVECKDYGKRSVSNEEVRNFATLVADARRDGTADQGLFVTTQGFTRYAGKFAAAHGITLTTWDELSTRLVNFDKYVKRLVEDWEGSPASRYYVDLTGSEVEDYRDAAPEQLHRPLEGLIFRLLQEKGRNHIALLGNFGTGKSTFCRRLAAIVADSYDRTRPDSRIPVLLNLSGYDPRSHIQEYITHTLQATYQVPQINVALCTELQRQGKFLFILDGFDEMVSQLNPFLIRDNLRSLNWLKQYPKNQVILTCRTHFFRDHLQAKNMADEFETVYLPEWSEPELREYLLKRFGDDWQPYLDRIHGTHNLTELAQTPLLLDMIATGLPQLATVQKRSDLYRQYTAQWLNDQDRRAGTWLERGQRGPFLLGLARKLYKEGRQTCHYTDLRPVLREMISPNDAVLDAVETDVRTCTFLTRDPQGNYEFKHKSFMEYFVADALAQDIESGECKALTYRTLPPEIRSFLVELLSDTAAKNLKALIEHEEHPIVLGNALTLLTDMGGCMTSVALQQSPEEMRETRLVAQLIQGEQSALHELAGEYWDEAAAAIVSVLGDVDEPLVEHLVTRTFATLFEDRISIMRVRDFRENLPKIARRLAFAHQKSSARRTASPVLRLSDEVEDIVHRGPVGDAGGAVPPAMQRLLRAISRRPDQEQQVINAHFLQELSRDQVAATLNLPIKQVNRIVYKALHEMERDLVAAGVKLRRR